MSDKESKAYELDPCCDTLQRKRVSLKISPETDKIFMWIDSDLVEIAYCPFCGEPAEIREVQICEASDCNETFIPRRAGRKQRSHSKTCYWRERSRRQRGLMRDT